MVFPCFFPLFSCWLPLKSLDFLLGTNKKTPRLLGGDELHEDFTRGATHVVLLHMHTAGPPKIPGIFRRNRPAKYGEMLELGRCLETQGFWKVESDGS